MTRVGRNHGMGQYDNTETEATILPLKLDWRVELMQREAPEYLSDVHIV